MRVERRLQQLLQREGIPNRRAQASRSSTQNLCPLVRGEVAVNRGHTLVRLIGMFQQLVGRRYGVNGIEVAPDGVPAESSVAA